MVNFAGGPIVRNLTGFSFQVISIKGSAESCSTACLEIMKIVQAEAQSLIKG